MWIERRVLDASDEIEPISFRCAVVGLDVFRNEVLAGRHFVAAGDDKGRNWDFETVSISAPAVSRPEQPTDNSCETTVDHAAMRCRSPCSLNFSAFCGFLCVYRKYISLLKRV